MILIAAQHISPSSIQSALSAIDGDHHAFVEEVSRGLCRLRNPDRPVRDQRPLLSDRGERRAWPRLFSPSSDARAAPHSAAFCLSGRGVNAARRGISILRPLLIPDFIHNYPQLYVARRASPAAFFFARIATHASFTIQKAGKRLFLQHVGCFLTSLERARAQCVRPWLGLKPDAAARFLAGAQERRRLEGGRRAFQVQTAPHRSGQWRRYQGGHVPARSIHAPVFGLRGRIGTLDRSSILESPGAS